MSIKDKLEDLNSLITEWKLLEAYEKYYAEDVVMQENDAEPTVGKEANLKREREFLANLTEFRGAEVKAVTLGEDVSMVEWLFDYTHKEWGTRRFQQVAVQHWKDGRIVHERFYYGA